MRTTLPSLNAGWATNCCDSKWQGDETAEERINQGNNDMLYPLGNGAPTKVLFHHFTQQLLHD
ncbi:MAG TPA: hypothetical protein VGI45_21640 [Terracidiphilus sp.]